MPTPIDIYLADVQRNLQGGNATEHTHRPALVKLLDSLATGLRAVNEPQHRVDCGAPDIVVMRTRGNLIIGHVETKDVGVSLADAQKSEQLRRYRKYLPNLLLTDYIDFHWYVDGDARHHASLGSVHGGTGRIRSTGEQQEQVLTLLRSFAEQMPQPINRPRALAERLARLTHMIRDIVVESFQRRKASAILRDLREVLADTLIPDLAQDEATPQFADLYAQTLTYGLFAARCHQQQVGVNAFKLSDAARDIPRTSPLLRQLFSAITGPDFHDEPYAGFVEELVAVLSHAAIEEILEDFGQAAVRQDPVLHFYETFLATYDPELRERRGVYYTPEPVVNYIVRSVDELLRSRFGIKDGLADTKKLKSPGGENLHRTLILDPAMGTGTFLYEVVRTIRDHFRRQRRAGLWSDYVHDHLLPRLFGFELLMAPYAMAHLKLGMELAAQDMPELEREMFAYGFSTDDRLQVYLTNTLEQVERHAQHMIGALHRAISDEAQQAARVKRDLPILVVLGNPPYSGISSNQGEWIDGLLKGNLPDGNATASYYHVDGKALGEKKLWLQDDYVKFIRWAQWRLEQTGHGILAFITNHGYLDNPTFRGMRWALMDAFDEIYVLDLHGNTKKKEAAPDGTSDQNVFDIRQGVAIGIFVKLGAKPRGGRPAKVHHADLWGRRDAKYDWLAEHSVETTKWKAVKPAEPFYLFKPFDQAAWRDYETWPRIDAVMPMRVTGVVTARDHFVIDFDRTTLLGRIAEFRDNTIPDDAIRSKYFAGKGSRKYSAGDTRGWKLPDARKQTGQDTQWDDRVCSILYRPFDTRSIYYVPWMVDWGRIDVMSHLSELRNLSLATTRSVEIGSGYAHVFATRMMIQHHTVSLKEVNYQFPLYVYPNGGSGGQSASLNWPPGHDDRRPNLDPEIVRQIERSVRLDFISDGRGDLKKTFGPEDVLAYIYAVFHWPEYRRRYEPMLKLDFPRVPPPEGRKRFVDFAKAGHELLAAHLLEDETLTGESVSFPVTGDNHVEKGYPKYVGPGASATKAAKVQLESDPKRGRVYINPSQYFEGVEPDVWRFQIGGYQVCEKWLKDRRGRVLGYEELTHYPRVVESLRRTIQLMARIEALGANG